VWSGQGTTFSRRQEGNYTLEGINAIADAMRVNGALTKLSLAQNKLEEAGTKAICEALEQNSTLKELDISGDWWRGSNTGGSAGAKHVAKMVRANGALTKLSLATNKLEEKGTKAICKALEQNTTLKELDISGFFRISDIFEGYSNIGGTAGAKHVAKMLGVNGALTVTDLLGNRLDAESAKVLADVAKKKGISLCGIRRDQTTADFRYQELQPPDAILLASDLSHAVVTGALTKLSLARNTLEEEGTKAICEALKQNKTLKELDLSDHTIGGERQRARAAAAREVSIKNFRGPCADHCKPLAPCCCVSADGEAIFGCVPTDRNYFLPACLHMALCPQLGCDPTGGIVDEDCKGLCLGTLLSNLFVCCFQHKSDSSTDHDFAW
jgi:hypothetical protein